MEIAAKEIERQDSCADLSSVLLFATDPSIGRLEPRPESTFPLVASEPQRNTSKGDMNYAENHSSLTHALPGKHTAA